jgi:hypothetical protein
MSKNITKKNEEKLKIFLAQTVKNDIKPNSSKVAGSSGKP